MVEFGVLIVGERNELSCDSPALGAPRHVPCLRNFLGHRLGVPGEDGQKQMRKQDGLSPAARAKHTFLHIAIRVDRTPRDLKTSSPNCPPMAESTQIIAVGKIVGLTDFGLFPSF